MTEISYEENMLNIETLKKTVCEIDEVHNSKSRVNPKIEFVNPLIEENTQDTLGNISSCVKMICKFTTPGDTDHSTLNLTADQMHGLYLFEECIANALDFEGWRTNLKNRELNNTEKEGV